MLITLLIEGSYPYITGGVSGWVHDLVTEMPNKKFRIVSIMSSRTEQFKIKYTIPSNVIDIQTFYLNDFTQLKPLVKKREPRIKGEIITEIDNFLRFKKETKWCEITKSIADQNQLGNVVEFLQSEIFYHLMLDYYNESYFTESFNEFFWTMRSMYMPLIHMMQSTLKDSDIFHSVSTGYAGLLGTLAKWRFNKPYILTEHGIYAREREEEILNAKWVRGIYKKFWIDFFYFISIGAYKSADHVVSLFERNRNIQIELGSDPQKTIVIPNGVDIQRFDRLKTEHEGHNIGAVLRIVPIKDVKTLLRAFRIVLSELPGSKLYLIGPYDEDQDYYRECVQLAKTLEVYESVVFTGRVDITEYMKKLDVMVLTSISEGQPLVILEGMAAGIPQIASDVGSCRELLEGVGADKFGTAGLITRPVNPTETAIAIMKILTDRKLSHQFGQNGQSRVQVYYRRDQFVEAYRNMYESLGEG